MSPAISGEGGSCTSHDPASPAAPVKEGAALAMTLCFQQSLVMEGASQGPVSPAVTGEEGSCTNHGPVSPAIPNGPRSCDPPLVPQVPNTETLILSSWLSTYPWLRMAWLCCLCRGRTIVSLVRRTPRKTKRFDALLYIIVQKSQLHAK